MADEVIPSDVRKDEIKMDSLYSPIRNAMVNPTDKISKVSFWKNVIGDYCKKNSQYTVSVSALKRDFHVDGRSPQCLEDVLRDMLQNKECVPVSEYLQKSPVSWSGWITHVLIKKPSSLLFSKLKDVVWGENLNSTFVHLDSLTVESDKLLSLVPNKYKDEILSLHDLLDVIKNDFPKLNTDNAEILVCELVKKSKADMKIQHSTNGQLFCVIKLYSGNVNPIGEVDIGIYKLRQKEKCLAEKTEQLETQINELREMAKNYIRKGQRHTAMTYLKKKNEVRKRMDKNSDALHNIHVMLEHLHMSETNHLVIQSYKEAVSSLKHTSKTVNEDDVHDIMDDISELLNINEDNAAALSKSLTEDDPSLEEELDSLIKAEEKEAEAEAEAESMIIAAMENLNITHPKVVEQKALQKL